MFSYFVVLFIILVSFKSESLDDTIVSFSAWYFRLLQSEIFSAQEYRIIDIFLILILLLICQNNYRIRIIIAIGTIRKYILPLSLKNLCNSLMMFNSFRKLDNWVSVPGGACVVVVDDDVPKKSQSPLFILWRRDSSWCVSINGTCSEDCLPSRSKVKSSSWKKQIDNVNLAV